MKKIVIFLIVTFLLFSYAIAEEITFNNIPWLSDEVTTMQTLYDIGLVREKEIVFTHDLPVYLIIDDTEFISPDHFAGAEEVALSVELDNIVKGKVAGYPLKNITLTFAYNGNYRLIAVKVDLIKGDYIDLKNKLTRVYGEAETKETEEGIWSTVWKGDNNSAVLLYTQSEGLDYTLIYGRLDATDLISQCLAPADPYDLSGL